jgi:hypothetical protein
MGVDRIHLPQGRDHWRDVVNTVVNLLIPQNSGKFSVSGASVGFSRRDGFHAGKYTSHFTVATSGNVKVNLSLCLTN